MKGVKSSLVAGIHWRTGPESSIVSTGWTMSWWRVGAHGEAATCKITLGEGAAASRYPRRSCKGGVPRSGVWRGLDGLGAEPMRTAVAAPLRARVRPCEGNQEETEQLALTDQRDLGWELIHGIIVLRPGVGTWSAGRFGRPWSARQNI